MADGDKFLEIVASLLNKLVNRVRRLKLKDDDFWVVNKNMAKQLENIPLKAADVSNLVLQYCPQAYPFEIRARVFKLVIEKTKEENGGNAFADYGPQIEINRGSILDDAIANLYQKNFNMQKNMRITFIDEEGMPEDGIDGGGLLKEFMTKLTAEIFDVNRAYWSETEGDRMLYPNAQIKHIDADWMHSFNFFGQVVGKALYESVLLKCNLAPFFLNIIVGKSN